MRFSKLSTISFGHINDFQENGVDLAVPILPIGKNLTIIEIGDDDIITSGGNSHFLPSSLNFVKKSTGKKTTISNLVANSIPCLFSAAVPAGIPCGRYYAEFEIGDETIRSDDFEIVLNDRCVAQICGNNVEEYYADGTPSILAGNQHLFYHYFFRNDFAETLIENSQKYDNSKGFAVSLSNQNSTKYTLKGYCSEYTANALGILCSSSFVNFSFKDKSGTSQFYEVTKIGEFSAETLSVKTRSFSCDFYAQKVVNDYCRLWNKEGGDFGLKISNTTYKIPFSWACQQYRNFYGQTKNGKILSFDFGRLLNSTSEFFFYGSYLPDNFLKCLKGFTILASKMHHADRILEFGDNVWLKTTSTNAKFSYIKKLGKNVYLPSINLSNYQYNIVTAQKIIENVNFGGRNTPIISGSGIIFKGYTFTSNNNLIVQNADVKVFENCIFYQSAFNYLKTIKKNNDILFENCKLAYKANVSTNFSFNELHGCTFKNCVCDNNIMMTMCSSDGTEVFDGKILNSFNKSTIIIDYFNEVPDFVADNLSFQGNVQEQRGAYLLSVQKINGRTLNMPTSYIDKVYPAAVDGGVLFMTGEVFKSQNEYLEFMTNSPVFSPSGYQYSEMYFPENYRMKEHEFVLAKINNANQAREVNFTGVIFSSNTMCQFSKSNSSLVGAIKIYSSQFLQAQSKKNLFNDISCDINIYNNFEIDFDYQLLRTNPTFMQDFEGTIYIYNDANAQLINRLQELYPTYTIVQVIT